MKYLIRFSLAFSLASALILTAPALAQSVQSVISVPFPVGVAVDPVAGLAYAANFSVPTVSVIDERTNSVVATITFPPGANGNQAELVSAAVNPINHRLYVADTHNFIVYVLDTRTNATIATIPGLSGSLAVNLRTNKIYVSEFGSTVEIIDGDTNRVTASVSIPFPMKAAIDLFTNRVYIASQNFFGDVFVLDGTTNAILAEIPTGIFTSSVGIDFLHHRAYAANQGFSFATSTLSVIDTDTNAVIATIPTDPFPTLTEVNPFTNRIFVINQVPNNVTTPTLIDVIDGETSQIIARVPISSTPEDSAFDLVHGLIFIASSQFEGGTTNAVTIVSTRPEER